MKRKSVQQYRERTEAGSMKKRSKLTWQSILGYLPVYPWINCEVSLDTFSGQFCGWKQPFDQLANHCPFSHPTQHAAMSDGVRCIGLRSTLHRPAEHAASAVAPPCLSHRYAFLLKSHPIEHSCLPSFPTHAFAPNYCAEYPWSAQTARKETGEGALRAIFQGNLQKNLSSCLHGRNN